MHGAADPVLSNDHCELESVGGWSAYLDQNENSRLIDPIRQKMMTGQPSGNDGLVQRFERLLHRALAPMPGDAPEIQRTKMDAVPIVFGMIYV